MVKVRSGQSLGDLLILMVSVASTPGVCRASTAALRANADCGRSDINALVSAWASLWDRESSGTASTVISLTSFAPFVH